MLEARGPSSPIRSEVVTSSLLACLPARSGAPIQETYASHPNPVPSIPSARASRGPGTGPTRRSGCCLRPRARAARPRSDHPRSRGVPRRAATPTMRSRAPAARTIVFRLPRCERSGHRGKVGRGGQPEPTAAVSARDSVIPPHAPAARASETPFSLAGVRSVRQPNLTVEGLGRLTVSSLNIVIDRWVCSLICSGF
ncbi:hypothetical protein SORBI_3004G298250 [Sorghum bicolor]|uniref:Uncharacterized protein n=1 Tax=Sorghum bicolor TaxID=4558 RepID=A0A1Z5RPQ5_SORBI|nr:hypothetical protein SORBI_3004G298250 [Sorghum bicolor]